MSAAAVTTERRDGVLIVHLDDGKANALSFDMIAAIHAAMDEAEGDDDIRAMVLHGRPGKFSAGFDLGVDNALEIGDVGARRRLDCKGEASVGLAEHFRTLASSATREPIFPNSGESSYP